MYAGDGWPPHHGGGLRWAGVGVTCSCAGPSAGGASPGAEPGSTHRPPWGLGLAPEPPAAPSSGSSGTGCRSAPLPGWMGTGGRKAPGFGGENLENGPNKGSLLAPRPVPWSRSSHSKAHERNTSEHVDACNGDTQTGFPDFIPGWGARPAALDPSPAPCSCAPSAASAPTASSSPGPDFPAPPRLQSPGSLQRTHDLGTSMRAERDWCVVRKRPPCPQACGD